jgi:DNA-nicking Smr family endonuclease
MSHFPPDDDDLIFFHNAMRDVKRTKRPSVRKSYAKKTVPFSHAEKGINDATKQVSDAATYALLATLTDPLEQKITAEDNLFFKRHGPQIKLIKKLIRGEISRAACLDLHAMTIEQARAAVLHFLLSNHKAGLRCVQIIHGKGQSSQGGARLKNHVNHWLRQIPWVLAFSSAQPRDGGHGAVYVLLAKSSG